MLKMLKTWRCKDCNGLELQARPCQSIYGIMGCYTRYSNSVHFINMIDYTTRTRSFVWLYPAIIKKCMQLKLRTECVTNIDIDRSADIYKYVWFRSHTCMELIEGSILCWTIYRLLDPILDSYLISSRSKVVSWLRWKPCYIYLYASLANVPVSGLYP